MIPLFIQAIRLFTTFLFGATGEIITEKSGHLNLGTPGIMCFGGVGGCLALNWYITIAGGPDDVNTFFAIIIAIIATLISAGLLGLIYSFMTVTLRANQNITGLTLTTFGAGLGGFYLSSIDMSALSRVANRAFNNLFNIPTDVSDALNLFFSYGILVYLAIIVTIATSIILKKTRIGLNLRAVGESPATADAVGINVVRYRYLATIVGAAIAGLGGLAFILDFSGGTFSEISSIEGLGWLAIALVIFSTWRPSIAIGGSFIFSVLYILRYYISISSNSSELIAMIPYVVTILVLIITSIIGGKLVQPPSSLGINYFREDR